MAAGDGVWITLMGALGLVMGSAASAVAYRVPRGLSWVRGRSACPACGHTLGLADLIPLVSFLAARGRCRHCGAPIGWRYPLTELMCAAWTILLYQTIGLGVAFPLLALWGVLLVALFWIDLDFQLLPDALTFPGTLLGVGAALVLPGGTRHALLGIVVASGLLWSIAWLYLRLRKIEGMGAGDVKLAAMFGAVLGWKLSLLTLFLAALAGSLWGVALILKRSGGGLTPLPFGSLLAPAALATFLWGDRWVQAYFAFLGGG